MQPQRRLVLYMSMSLDGFAARRDGTMDWLGEKQAHGAYRQRGVAELLGQTGLLVLGRRSAEQMAQAWPSSQSPTGELMNALPKVVFSSTLTHLTGATPAPAIDRQRTRSRSSNSSRARTSLCSAELASPAPSPLTV